MTSLYKVLQKAIPLCTSHQGQALFYNIDQHSFVCQQCINPVQHTFQADSTSQDSHKNKDSIFSLKEILSNPILLMLRQNSFLAQLSPENNKYHVNEFLNILTDIENFIKTKKSSIQCTKEFMALLKESITKKIDWVISRSEQNLIKICQIQDKAQYLKRINTEYYNQFLQTLEQTYVNGTSQQLNDLLKKYSIENENPFRRVQQKVIQITKDISQLREINWQGCLKLQSRLLDPYIWSEQKLFLIQNPSSLVSKRQQSVILPDAFPHLLGFAKQTSTYHIDESLNQPIENDPNSFQNNVYLKCFGSTLQILLKNNQGEDNFHILDSIEWEDSSIDMVYELPQKMLMGVSYSCIKFYSYQLNRIEQISSLSLIKGCRQVLIFEDFCVILGEDSLYKIRYSQQSKAQQIRLKIPDDQVVTGLQYLFQSQRKRQDFLLAKTQNKQNGKIHNLKLRLS